MRLPIKANSRLHLPHSGAPLIVNKLVVVATRVDAVVPQSVTPWGPPVEQLAVHGPMPIIHLQDMTIAEDGTGVVMVVVVEQDVEIGIEVHVIETIDRMKPTDELVVLRMMTYRNQKAEIVVPSALVPHQ